VLPPGGEARAQAADVVGADAVLGEVVRVERLGLSERLGELAPVEADLGPFGQAQ
jgi:hypothetical protein